MDILARKWKMVPNHQTNGNVTNCIGDVISIENIAIGTIMEENGWIHAPFSSFEKMLVSKKNQMRVTSLMFIGNGEMRQNDV